jgi:hypothetical protein
MTAPDPRSPTAPATPPSPAHSPAHSPAPPPPSRLRDWLTLLRAPNLLTVPGDPLAGAFLAAQSSHRIFPALIPVLIASLCFYAAGMLWNDVYDLRHDRAARRPRPLVTGRIHPRPAWIAGLALNLLGLALCALAGTAPFWIGLALVTLATAYNLQLKRLPGLGNLTSSLTMGLCRGANLLLGAAALPIAHPLNAPALAGALLLTAYIFTVTHLARGERTPHNPGIEISYPATLLLLAPFFLLPLLPPGNGNRWLSALVYAATLAATATLARRLWRYRAVNDLEESLRRRRALTRTLPAAIGHLLRLLCPLQAALILWAATGPLAWTTAAVLLLAGLLHIPLTRSIHAS